MKHIVGHALAGLGLGLGFAVLQLILVSAAESVFHDHTVQPMRSLELIFRILNAPAEGFGYVWTGILRLPPRSEVAWLVVPVVTICVQWGLIGSLVGVWRALRSAWSRKRATNAIWPAFLGVGWALIAGGLVALLLERASIAELAQTNLPQVNRAPAELTKEGGRVVGLPREKTADPEQGDVTHENHSDQRSGVPALPVAKQRPKPQWSTWFSAGPGWRELRKAAAPRGIQIRSFNHSPVHYQRILADSPAGATIVLLFALDHEDKRIPAEYQDLLPIPWTVIEAALKKGQTVERTGTARQREIVLLAAPTQRELEELIRHTTLLAP